MTYKLMVRFLLWIGLIFSFNQLSAQQVETILKMESDALKLKDGSEKAIAYLNLGDAYRDVDSDKSLGYLNFGYALAKQYKDTLAISSYHYLISLQYLASDQFLLAANESGNAAFYYKQLHDSLNYLLSVYIQMRSLAFTNHQEKIGVLMEAANAYIGQNNNFQVQMGMLHSMFAYAYQNIDFEKSIEHYKIAINYFKTAGEHKWLVGPYNSLAKIYNFKRKLDSTILYSRLCLELSDKIDNYDELDYVIPASSLIMLLPISNKVGEAQELNSKLVKLINRLKSKNIKEQKKFLQISLLKAKQQQQRFDNFMLIAGLIIAALVLLIGGFSYQKIQSQKKRLANSLEQNQLLLKETNHRVKNNFQMIMSLLRLYKNEQGQVNSDFIDVTIGRVGGMSKVHELLYKRGDLTRISVYSYLSEIAETIIHTYSDHPENISVKILPNEFEFNLETIMPLGLIVNEMIINTLKYAFGKSGSGQIEMRLESNDNTYTLYYRDNGKGVDHFGSRGDSIGIALMKSLSKQINGEFQMYNEQGLCYKIQFT